MAIYGPKVRSVGNSKYPLRAWGAHIFKRDYFEHSGASGDVRGAYQDLNVTSTGSGETLRLRGIASGTGVAADGNALNALHATGRVASGGTLSKDGWLHAIRATLEVAGTTPTPGGKQLAAIRVDSNIVTGATMGADDAFIAIGDNGATGLTNLFAIEQESGTASATTLTSTYKTATQVGKIGIKCRIGGNTRWILATDVAPTT
jgi:hypothetical protein